MMAAFSGLENPAAWARIHPLSKEKIQSEEQMAIPIPRGGRARLTNKQALLIHRFVEEAAAKERLDPALIRAVIRVESAYDYRAVSRAGARGLMQIMPQTAIELGERRALDHTNPRANILAGAHLLRRLVNRYQGNLKLALAAYNAGPGAVARYGGVPPFPETQDYVKKVARQFALEQRKQ